MGITDALFCMSFLVQRCMDMNRNVNREYIDYEKVFGNVNHQKLISLLKKVVLDDKLAKSSHERYTDTFKPLLRGSICRSVE